MCGRPQIAGGGHLLRRLDSSTHLGNFQDEPLSCFHVQELHTTTFVTKLQIRLILQHRMTTDQLGPGASSKLPIHAKPDTVIKTKDGSIFE